METSEKDGLRKYYMLELNDTTVTYLAPPRLQEFSSSKDFQRGRSRWRAKLYRQVVESFGYPSVDTRHLVP